MYNKSFGQMESHDTHSINISGSERQWSLCGQEIPKSEIVFFCQVIILYTVILTSIYNLTRGNSELSNLWTSLLSGSLGYLLPNPTIKKRHVLSHTT